LKASSETERAHPNDETGQGDILSIEFPVGVAGPKLGIVINADCDLAHEKIDGVIAYLPIYTFKEYLKDFWAPGHLDEILKQSAKAVADIIDPGKNGASEICSWVAIASIDAVVNKIATLAHVKKNQIPSISDHIKKIAICSNSAIDSLHRFAQICQLQTDPLAHSKKQISLAKKAMGQDHFFITDIVNCSEVGFVVRMRRIYTIDQFCCFTSSSAQKLHDSVNAPTAFRIGRLTPHYRFRIIQLFAQQYSRVGLPDEVTALSELAIEDMASQIAMEFK